MPDGSCEELSMHRHIPIISLCLLAVAAIPAAAADRREPRAQEWQANTAQPLRYNWNGVYAGLHSGGAFERFTGVTRKSRNEALLGGQIGYNMQAGSMVYGLETDFSMNGFGKGSSRGVVGTNADMRYTGTAKARVGVAFDRALVYATGGLAYGSLKATSGNLSKTKGKTGYVVGAGVEYGITQNWSAKLEYNYVSLGKQDFQFGPSRKKIEVNEHLVKAGVNYRF
jgi:outer membrane immunogenic protein